MRPYKQQKHNTQKNKDAHVHYTVLTQHTPTTTTANTQAYHPASGAQDTTNMLRQTPNNAPTHNQTTMSTTPTHNKKRRASTQIPKTKTP